jgi:translation initiation factor 1
MAKKGGWREFDQPRSAAPTERPSTTVPKAQQRVRVQRTKSGKGGKTVTTINGLEASDHELKALLKQLKAALGSGGAIKSGVIELQGDQVGGALSALEKEGYRPKQAGG